MLAYHIKRHLVDTVVSIRRVSAKPLCKCLIFALVLVASFSGCTDSGLPSMLDILAGPIPINAQILGPNEVAKGAAVLYTVSAILDDGSASSASSKAIWSLIDGGGSIDSYNSPTIAVDE